MIAALISLATSRLAGPVALAGCAVLSIALIGAKMETGRVKADLKAQVADSRRLATDLGTCRGNVSNLTASVDRQNAAVEALKAEGDRRAQAAEKAASDARKARAVAESYAREAAAYRSAGTCEEREAGVRALVGDLKR